MSECTRELLELFGLPWAHLRFYIDICCGRKLKRRVQYLFSTSNLLLYLLTATLKRCIIKFYLQKAGFVAITVDLNNRRKVTWLKPIYGIVTVTDRLLLLPVTIPLPPHST